MMWVVQREVAASAGGVWVVLQSGQPASEQERSGKDEAGAQRNSEKNPGDELTARES